MSRRAVSCLLLAALTACHGSSGSSAAAPAAPTAPSHLRANVDQELRLVELAWRDHSIDEQAFRIERRAIEEQWHTHIDVAADTVAFAEEVEADTRYWYRVRAIRGTLQSAASNEAAVVVGTPPPNGCALVFAAPIDPTSTLGATGQVGVATVGDGAELVDSASLAADRTRTVLDAGRAGRVAMDLVHRDRGESFELDFSLQFAPDRLDDNALAGDLCLALTNRTLELAVRELADRPLVQVPAGVIIKPTETYRARIVFDRLAQTWSLIAPGITTLHGLERDAVVSVRAQFDLR